MAVGCSFRDADLGGDIPQPHLRVLGHAHQHMCLIREKRPLRREPEVPGKDRLHARLIGIRSLWRTPCADLFRSQATLAARHVDYRRKCPHSLVDLLWIRETWNLHPIAVGPPPLPRLLHAPDRRTRVTRDE